MICVPLKDLTQVVGCLQLANKEDGSPFDADELRLCKRLAALPALISGGRVKVNGKITFREVYDSWFPGHEGKGGRVHHGLLQSRRHAL